MTKGPFEWVGSEGTIRKRYYVLVSAEFDMKLESAKSSPILSGSPQPAFIPPADATWYKRAPEEINQKAKSKLEYALSIKAADTNTDGLFAGAGGYFGAQLALAGEGGVPTPVNEFIYDSLLPRELIARGLSAPPALAGG